MYRHTTLVDEWVAPTAIVSRVITWQGILIGHDEKRPHFRSETLKFGDVMAKEFVCPDASSVLPAILRRIEANLFVRP